MNELNGSGTGARSHFRLHGKEAVRSFHFGAVDWDATVYVNGKQVARTAAATDPFSFDITGALLMQKGLFRKSSVGVVSIQRWRRPAAGKAGAPAERHLVHTVHGNLADGLCASRSCFSHHAGPHCSQYPMQNVRRGSSILIRGSDRALRIRHPGWQEEKWRMP